MTDEKQRQIQELVDKIPDLTSGQLYWLQRVTAVFKCDQNFIIHREDILDAQTLYNFGDALRIHHCFSAEAFSKDKFEYVLDRVVRLSDRESKLAPRGHSGHDITIDGVKISLKTQANKSIRSERLWISKFMELGKGAWGDEPADLVGLRNAFLAHLRRYDRIFTLRALQQSPHWRYELVEIPRSLLLKAKNGELKMMTQSKQFPKPGYCFVRTRSGEELYHLYFDGGSERKLQIKNLTKARCCLHATWQFTIPPD